MLADPAVPPAALRVFVDRDVFQVAPYCGAEVLLDRQPLRAAAVWRPGQQVTVGASFLEIAPWQPPDAALRPAPDGAGLEFNRPPRLLPPGQELAFTLPAPPGRPDRRPVPVLMSVVPVVLGVAMALFFRQPYMLATTQVQVRFPVPDGRIATADDTTFDGMYSIPQPDGKGQTRSTVVYEPGNVNVFLPEAIVEHPSFPRMTTQITAGAATYASATALFLLGWNRRRRRLRQLAPRAVLWSAGLTIAALACLAGVVVLAVLRGSMLPLTVLIVAAPVLTAAAWLILTHAQPRSLTRTRWSALIAVARR